MDGITATAPGGARRRLRQRVVAPDPAVAAHIASLPEHPSMEAKVRALRKLEEIWARRELAAGASAGDGQEVA